MPSTATTNITIGTLLDLIGPSSIAAPSADGPPFDALLQNEPPTRQSEPGEENQRSFDAAENSTSYAPTSSEFADAGGSAEQDVDSPYQFSEEQDTAPAELPTGHDTGLAASDEANEVAVPDVAQVLAVLPVIAPVLITVQPQQAVESSADGQETVDAVEANSSQKTGRRQSGKPGVAASKATDGLGEAQATALTPETNPAESKQPSAETASTAENASRLNEDATRTIHESRQPSTETLTDSAPVNAVDGLIPELTASAGSTSRDQANPQANRSETNQPANANLETISQSADQPAARTDAAPLVAAVQPVQATQGPSNTGSNSSSNAPVTAVGSPGRARLPAEFLSQRSTGPTRPGAVEIDSTRLLSRVARAFAAAQERDGEIRLRLSPPELGSLRLEVRVENGGLIARLQTETDAARTAIIDNLPALRDRLNEQGVRIERFDVDLMQRQPGGMPDQTGGGQQEPPTPTAPFVSTSRPRSEPAVPSSASTAGTANSTSGLNVII